MTKKKTVTYKTTQSQWSSLNPPLILIPQSAGVLKTNKTRPRQKLP